MSYSEREDQVRRYYDRNTGVFLRFARAFQPKAIHQPLYEDPDMPLMEALHTADRIVLHRIQSDSHVRSILDLGCGVGSTLIFLASHVPDTVSFHGLTLSGEQVASAAQSISKLGIQNRVRIWEGSFQAIPDDIPVVDMAFAIEAFIHSPDPQKFFQQLSDRLSVGGQLVLIDDFLASEANAGANQKILHDLRTGYMAHTVLTPERVSEMAASVGLRLEISRDLTHMLKLNRLRDKLVRFVVPVAAVFQNYSEYCRFLVGGNARQEAFKHGTLAYRLMVFRKN